MKSLFSVVGILLIAASSLTAQAPGFGAGGAAGPTFQAGDQAQVTARILSATRYRLTPGDTYTLSITMSGVATYNLVLQENFDLEVPYMGTLNVKGMYFSDLRKTITERIKRVLPLAEFISLTLLSPARFDVPVFGGVATPGIVTVYPLARVSDAIAMSGGRKPGASYRTINLMRGEQKIVVDLLRYGMEAKSDQDPFLEPGDRILVPQAQLVVTLVGDVKYPGPFELVPGETLQSLISYAGGVLPGARTSSVEVVRFMKDGTSTQQIVDLGTDSAMTLADGDRIRVPSIVENRNMILVLGAVFGAPVAVDKPVQIPMQPVSVNIPYTPGLSLLTVLEDVGGPTPYARAKESLIVRKKTGERITLDVDSLWASKDPARDVQLEPGDTVDIPMVVEVVVAGEVNGPGKFPYNPALVVSDYLVAAGGVNADTGDPNAIYFLDKKGARTKAGLASSVQPGSVIYVDRNAITAATHTFTNITVVTGFVTAIIAFLTTIIDFIRIWVP
jgi:protein involved in polysaccharide export with SLBB domain